MESNYFQYFISQTGKVYLNGEIIPPVKDQAGHLSVNLKIEGERKRVRVSKMLCTVYKDVPENEKAIIFLDNDKMNLDLDNMKTVTTTEAGVIHAKKSTSPPVTTSHSRKRQPEPKRNLASSVSWV